MGATRGHEVDCQTKRCLLQGGVSEQPTGKAVPGLGVEGYFVQVSGLDLFLVRSVEGDLAQTREFYLTVLVLQLMWLTVVWQ